MKTPRMFVVSLASCLLVTGSFAASDYYLKIEGVDGESKAATDKGHKDWIEVSSMSLDRNDVVAPRDAPSGLATGKRQHKPISITKPIDKATPILAKAMANGTVFKNVEIGGPDGVYQLHDVTVAGITPVKGGDRSMETLSLNYTKIEIVPKKDKKEAVSAAPQPQRAATAKPEAKRAPN